ncbi:unnamed protein product [Larinioides sclopetarius]|uniref:Uncharacterized protein n=1 Tax=Larinioides sclopetarius TaxID=280406 RepID=A0AAV2BZT6_9ARAC
MEEFSPDRAFSHSNGIAVQKETTKVNLCMLVNKFKMAAIKVDTDFGITKEFKKKMNEETTNMNFNVQEVLPGQKKVNDLDPSDGVIVLKMNLNTCEAPVYSSSHSSQKTISRSEERYFHYTLSSSPNMLNNQYKPLIRRNVRQEEIAFNRECKKLEVVWTNRGLPVDKESLHSLASKDAFDMSDLNESLPSTSASEKKQNVLKYRRRLPLLHSREVGQLTNREIRIFTSQRRPLSDAEQSICDSLEQSVLRNAMLRHSHLRSQRFASFKRKHFEVRDLVDLDKESDCDKQKEAGEAIFIFKSEFPILNHQEPTRHCNIYPEFDKMSLDVKPQEKSQNSDAENNQESIGLSLLPKSHQDVGQSSSWDSERNWVTDFDVPNLRVPLNSPTKEEGKAFKNDSFQRLKEKLLDNRLRSWQLSRANLRLRALNYHRGVPSGDMDDESKSENPSLEQASNQNSPVSPKLVEALNLNKLIICRKMLNQLNQSVKNFRTFQNRFPLGNVKSDKVVPD